MAYRRSLFTIKSTFLARRLNLSFTHISQNSDHANNQELHSSGSKIDRYSTQNRSFGNYVNNPSWQLSHAFRRTGYGLLENRVLLNRYMSTSTGDEDKIDIITSEVVTSISNSPNAVEAVSEIVNASANTPDVGACAMQYLFDGAHSLTGFSWWASIALTTLFIRGLSIPYLIQEVKDASKFKLVMSRMGEDHLSIRGLSIPDLIEQVIDASKFKLLMSRMWEDHLQMKGMETKEMRDSKMSELCKQYGLKPKDPRGRIKAMFIEGYVFSQSSLLGLYFMAKYVSSFETGGALWFSNLTTPDDTYIFASLTAATVLTSVFVRTHIFVI